MSRGIKKITSRMQITMTPDTEKRLRALAEQEHTSVSQLITTWTWKTKLVHNDQLCNQINTNSAEE